MMISEKNFYEYPCGNITIRFDFENQNKKSLDFEILYPDELSFIVQGSDGFMSLCDSRKCKTTQFVCGFEHVVLFRNYEDDFEIEIDPNIF